MTEGEWLAARCPRTILESLKFKRTDRKLRLFTCACIRDEQELLANELDVLIEKVEALADGLATFEDVRNAIPGLYDLEISWGEEDEGDESLEGYYCAKNAVITLTAHLDDSFLTALGACPQLADAEEFFQCELLRDIFGNPFRPVVFDPNWRTSTVVAIAKAMYESRDFSPMPILADALQEAGCENADILNHCRSDGPHVKGCWVVDLVLGKA